MKILLTFDSGYAPHAATVMESVIMNCPEKLDFIVIYYDLTDEIRDILKLHFYNRVKSLEFYKLDERILSEILKDTKTASHLIGLNTYIRIFAAEILPSSDDYVIYMDCDIIVLKNILDIMKDVDLNKPLCAVKEYDPKYKLRDLGKIKYWEHPVINPLIYEAYWYRTYLDLHMDLNVPYFNAGVMIVNLNYWREHHFKDRLLKFMTNNSNLFSADQDALNSICNGNFGVLEPKWNSVVLNSGIMNNYDFEGSPSILHFAGPVKPWHYTNISSERKEYLKYRKKTPWKKIKYADKISVKRLLYKNLYGPIKRIIEFLLGRKTISFFKNYQFKEEKYWSKVRMRIN